MYERPIINKIRSRLYEPKIQVLLGARQVGKTTLIHQVLKKINTPSHYVVAESGFNLSWIEQQWAVSQAKAIAEHCILVIDQIQKIDNWSERVKRLYDENVISQKKVHIILLGSSSLSIQKGLSESMAGRYEITHIPHWSLKECEDAFGLTLDEYIFFGGYPGSLAYRDDEDRFFSYIQESIVEPVVSRDILSQHLITKPALLRELFRLGSEYSGQILAFNKMLGQLQDAGNTTTLSHYLSLLEQTYVLKGIYKYTNSSVRTRQSPPKLQVYNMALQTSSMKSYFKEFLLNTDLKGRFVESCVGACLFSNTNATISYWREDNKEVDFVVKYKGKVIAIEVKSGKKFKAPVGLEEFSKQYHVDVKLLIGGKGIPLDVFLKTPLEQFLP